MEPQLEIIGLIAPIFWGGLFIVLFMMIFTAALGAIRQFIDWLGGRF